MHAGAVQFPEMRRIVTFVQVLINDVVQLFLKGRVGACRRHRIKPVASVLPKIRVVALGDRRKLDTPANKSAFEHVGQITRSYEHGVNVVHDQNQSHCIWQSTHQYRGCS